MQSQTSPFPTSTVAGVRTLNADADVTVDLFIGDNAEVSVFHDKPFSKCVSWLEYDSRTNMVDFVMEDGDLRNFGIPVDPKLRAYFHNTHIVSIIQLNPTTKKVENGMDLPLIIHAA